MIGNETHYEFSNETNTSKAVSVSVYMNTYNKESDYFYIIRGWQAYSAIVVECVMS